MASGGRRGTFAFDLSKPLKKGMLLKQGQLHKAFKHRYFVLYPGFLVYYDDMSKWKLDITRGETLGGRLGAVKLRDGSVSIARSAPKGCKFGLIVHAPDPSNKRMTYLLNATSKEDRNEWIEAISKATPQSKNSPRAARKDVKQRTNPEPKQKEELPRPKYTERQTTANEAALLSTEDQSENDKVTSIDEQIEPSITVRHDTANIAALIGSCEANESVEENGEPVTSIDEVLGPKLDGDHSSKEGNSRSESPVNEAEEEGQEKLAREVEHDQKTEDDSQAPVETTESVQSSLNEKGNLEVVTSVSVPVVVAAVANGTENGEHSPKSESDEGVIDDETAETKAQDQGTDKQLEANGSSEGVQSSEVMFTHEENPNPISVTVANMEDSSDSTSSDGDSPQLAARGIPSEDSLPPGVMVEQLSKEEVKTEGTSAPPSITIQRVPTLEENKKPVVEDAEQNGGRKDSSGSDKSTEGLTPGNQKRRRSSTPFIEKTGFLYKMGGHRPTWKLRYFVLRPGIFSYYKKNNTNTKPLGVVKLKNLQIFFPGVGERRQSYQFTVHTESSWNKRSDWVMAGQSERETKEWIAAFKVAGMKVSPPGSDEETEVATRNGAIQTH